MPDYADRILKLVSEPDYKPMTLKAMSRRFKVAPDDYAEFRATVKRLVKDGKLDLAKDKTLQSPDRAGLVVGVFRRSSRGFGFVRPHAGAERSDQIYIAPDVRRRRLHRRRGGGQGHQAAAPSRDECRGADRPDRVAGGGDLRRDLLRGGRRGLRPDRRHDVPRHRSTSAIPGPRAQSRATRSPSRWSDIPRPTRRARGSSPRSSADAAQPGVDTLTVIRAFNIPDTFDDEVLDEAREQAKRFDESEIGQREDLRDVLTVTIDPATAATSTTRSRCRATTRGTGAWVSTSPTSRTSSGPARRWTGPPSTGGPASTSPIG